jgi:hypothetical protein
VQSLRPPWELTREEEEGQDLHIYAETGSHSVPEAIQIWNSCILKLQQWPSSFLPWKFQADFTLLGMQLLHLMLLTSMIDEIIKQAFRMHIYIMYQGDKMSLNLKEWKD